MSETPFTPEVLPAIAHPLAPVADPPLVLEMPDATVATPAVRFRRIPHLGHLALLGLFLFAGLACAIILILVAVQFRLFGISHLDDAARSLPYAIGTMLAFYLIALVPSAIVFPMLWGRSLPAGLQWNASAVRRLWPWLIATGAGCFLIAVTARSVLHFPDKSPISGLMNTPTAVWIMFAFSVTVAPLCEEAAFRGFVLPAFATAFDWTGEKLTRRAPGALLENGHPSWSLPAMLFGSVVASVLFALVHAGQLGDALGPIVLIFCVSLVLCAVRLITRSLAASTLTHATYNFTLFVIMAIGSHGFQHLHN